MRENYRKSIASMKKFPQFTTMNVIDGQAGLIICASLIFYSLTIDNILNIIVLLILAGITISMLTGNNSLIKNALKAKEAAEIDSEREQLEIATTQAMGKDKYGDVKRTGLQKALDKNVGENETEVTEEEGITDLTTQFMTSKRYYTVTRDGKVTYLGDEETLSNTATITADPESDTTPKLTYNVTVTVKTGIVIDEEYLKLKYAWSTSDKEAPSSYTVANLTGTGKTKQAQISNVDTEEGDYYLWVKAVVGENETEIIKTFGPYRIKDHTTLRVCSSEYNSSSKFLNSDTVRRNKVKSVTLVDSIDGHSTADSNCWDVSQSQNGKILAWYEVDENGYYSVTIGQNGGVVANSDSSSLFRYIGYSVASGTEVKIEGLNNLDTSLVTNMSTMFYECSGLTSLDVSKFDTSSVTNMSHMFYECSGLTSLDVSKFDTSSVTSMSFMFGLCSKLTSLDVSNFDTSSVTDMGYMFYYCSGLTSLDVSNFDTSSVTNMGYMFYDCSGLTSLDVSNFDTSSVTSMRFMFGLCSKLMSLDVSNFDTSSVTKMDAMFYYCRGLTSLDVSNFDTSSVTNMGYMFHDCSGLTSLDVSNFDTSSITNMASMFNDCRGLTSLDVSNFDTSSVTSMDSMFASCSKLTSLDVSNFDTSSVTNIERMFSSCSGLTSLDVSNFDTSSVTSMDSMFASCSKLTSLDVSNFDTSSVTNMASMFNDCSGLTSLDVSNFDTSSVTDMTSMFRFCTGLTSLNVSGLFNTSSVKYMGHNSTSTSSPYDTYGMFYGCSGLTELDLSTWDTSNVLSMRGLFYGCENLNTLKLNNFTTSQITDAMYYNAMFTNVPTTIQITTNSTMKTWLETNFADWAGNITTV